MNPDDPFDLGPRVVLMPHVETTHTQHYINHDTVVSNTPDGVVVLVASDGVMTSLFRDELARRRDEDARVVRTRLLRDADFCSIKSVNRKARRAQNAEARRAR